MEEKVVNQKKVNDLLAKIKEVQTKNKLDLSAGEDLSVGLMNLIGLEEHFFFTATKTGNIKYLDLLNEIRVMRVELMKRIVKDTEGEVWCISKHLLAASMRLNEVGTKSLKRGEKEDAWNLFKMAYQLYSLFWGLNLGVVESKEMKANLAKRGDLAKLGFEKDEFVDSEKIASGKGTVFNKLGELVKRVIDCCIE